jgi:DNA-binding NtrC family response regulator
MVSNAVLDRVKGWLRREPKEVVPRTILIVDNKTNDRRTTADRVVRLGYQALEAGTIARAIEQLDEHDPDCVLLAFDLPDAKGLTGLERIRELDPGLEVIMLANDWRDGRTAEAMRQGAVAYLAKPFSQDDLRELLARR